MTICFFGNYKEHYSRNQVLFRGFKTAGISILEVHTSASGLKKYWQLFCRHWKVRRDYDILFVAFPGHSIAWFARLLTRKPLVVDVFVSLYLSDVLDRRKISPHSLQSVYLRLLDWLACLSADLILLDTGHQIDFFASAYHIARLKFFRLFVGSDNYTFHPLAVVRNKNKFIVHWHGYPVPFHGLGIILSAAKKIWPIDPQIHFQIVGLPAHTIARLSGELNLSNISFFGPVGDAVLNTLINSADICLGVFGDNVKARVVIPNKLYESAAAGIPAITGRQAVIMELFTAGENIVFCRPGDPDDLAEKIIYLKNNLDYRLSVGHNSLQLFNRRLTPPILVTPLIAHLKLKFNL